MSCQLYLFHFSYFLCFSDFGSINYRRIISVKTVLVNLAKIVLIWSQTWWCLSKGNMCIHKTVHHMMWPFNTELAFPLGRDGKEHDNNYVFYIINVYFVTYVNFTQISTFSNVNTFFVYNLIPQDPIVLVFVKRALVKQLLTCINLI